MNHGTKARQKSYSIAMVVDLQTSTIFTCMSYLSRIFSDFGVCQRWANFCSLSKGSRQFLDVFSYQASLRFTCVTSPFSGCILAAHVLRFRFTACVKQYYKSINLLSTMHGSETYGTRATLGTQKLKVLHILFFNDSQRRYIDVDLHQWCSNRGPRATCGRQGPLEWPAKQFSLERKLNTLIV